MYREQADQMQLSPLPDEVSRNRSGMEHRDPPFLSAVKAGFALLWCSKRCAQKTAAAGADRRKSNLQVRKGSMTVEASICVPLFFLSVVGLICLLNLYSLQGRKTVELQEKAESLARGVSLTGGDPIIDLKEAAVFRIRFFPFSLGKLRIACRGRVRAWTGAEDAGNKGTTNEENDTLVYVTDFESVYHTESNCTHLDLQIQEVSKAHVDRMRNAYGARYCPCERCIGSKGAGNIVYVGTRGDRYHSDPSCGGLQRHTRLVRKSEVNGRCQCARCAVQAGRKAAG